MKDLKITRHGRFIVASRASVTNQATLIGGLASPEGEIRKGRGAVKILSAEGSLFACRQYHHGGLLRALTGDIFFTAGRAERELDITAYLEEKGFPVVPPLGYIIEKRSTTKRLFFLSFFVENRGDLLEYLERSSKKTRFRIIRDMSRLLAQMGKLGVYHPDLHLQNALVSNEHGLVLLDFDKAYRKAVTKKDMEEMLWRLNRFAEKKEKKGELSISLQEKIFFLRVFERAWGEKIIDDMARSLESKRRGYRLGWLLESLLYGRS